MTQGDCIDQDFSCPKSSSLDEDLAIMPVCKFFQSRTGCARGDKCYFQHVQLANLDQLSLADSTSNWRIGDRSSVIADRAPLPDLPSPLSNVPCYFFSIGACKNGDACRFQHDAKNEKAIIDVVPEQAPENKTPESTKPNVRELSGATVTFGVGADVSSIIPAISSAARLQMCNVSCTWFQPSKTATLVFTSSQSMEAAEWKLGCRKIQERTLECRTAVNKKKTPWECFVKIGNVNVSTTLEILKSACGQHKPATVKFGPNSYSSSDETIGKIIERLLSSVETITMAAPRAANGNQMKSTATFSTMERATKAVNEFNGHKLYELGGSKIRLSHVVKAKFSILTSMHIAILPELDELKQSLRSKYYLEIKYYPPSSKANPFTTLHIISDTAREVARAKAAVEKILKGHIARGSKDVIWDDLFLKPEGIAYLNNLGKEHDVFIYRNARRCTLSLYGNEENKTIVESALLKTVEDLAVATFTVNLDDEKLAAALQGSFRRIVEKLGKSAARLNITTSPKTITVQGSRRDADWVERVLQEGVRKSLGQTTVGPEGAKPDDSATCPVCWCEVTETIYTTTCGHTYDLECFTNQCLSADAKDIPIICLHCQAPIPFSELEAVLTREQFDKLLENSFSQHVSTRPQKYQYCPTAGCDQIYEVSTSIPAPPASPASDKDDNGSDSANNEIFTCPTCLTQTCTKCSAVSHEGLTCAQYKSTILADDDALASWKRKNDARDCPNCGVIIQKSEGCNHMTCRICKVHICWVCMKVFKKGGQVYEHLTEEHGGCFEEGYGAGFG